MVKDYILKQESDENGVLVSTKLMRKSSDKTKMPQLVIPIGEIFDYIDDAHKRVNHKGVKSTYNEVSSSVYSVTEDDVKNYVGTCPICSALAREASQNQFIQNNRFELEVIDFTEDPGTGANGTQFRWLMSLKQINTGNVYLRPLQSNLEEETNEEISHILGFLGVTAPSILRATRDTDLGSVSRPVEQTKEILYRITNANSKKSTDTSQTSTDTTRTWVQWLGACMHHINRSNLQQQQQQQDDPDTKPAAKPTIKLEADEDSDDDSSTVDKHGVQQQHEQQQQHQEQLEQQHDDPNTKPAAEPAKPTKIKMEENFCVVPLPTPWSENKVHLRSGFCEVLPSQSWERAKLDELHDKIHYRLLNVRLDCIQCRLSCATTVPVLFLYEASYYDLMRTTNRNFDQSLISAFIVLKMHQRHIRTMMYDYCPVPVPLDQIPTRTHGLPSNITTLIVVCWEGLHYGFLEINVPNRYVLVKDGFLNSSNVGKWNAHVVFMLHKWELITDSVTQVLECRDLQTTFERTTPTTPVGVFEIVALRTVAQRNVTECGAIAAYHAWEVIHPASKPSSVDSFRVDVINDLVFMWEEFDSCLRVRLKTANLKETQQIMRINPFGSPVGYCDTIDKEEITPRDTRPERETEKISTPDVIREVKKTLKRSAAETTVASSKRQNVPNDIIMIDTEEIDEEEKNVPNDVIVIDDKEIDEEEITPRDKNDVNGNVPAQKQLFLVEKVYQIVRKITGTLGGSGSQEAPIYGELTQGSMTKMVDLMKEHTNLDSSSFFLDVGSGIGKPNFHVAIDPGVQVSFGLEVDADRWLLSMNCLIATLRFAADDIIPSKQDDMILREQLAKQKCIFIKGDIKNAKVFDPFTHVYMFSIGFPPSLWLELARIWNRSASPYLICFHAPKDVIGKYRLNAELLAQQQTNMHGSQQKHTAYVYRRPSAKKMTIDIDPLFAEGIQIVQGGFDCIRKWAEKMNAGSLHSGRRTRRSPVNH